jgi:hypothetical protein
MNFYKSLFGLLCVCCLAAPQLLAQTSTETKKDSPASTSANVVGVSTGTLTAKTPQEYLDSLFQAKYGGPSPFKFALSVGYRWFVADNPNTGVYGISPTDSTLRRERDADYSDFVLSGTVTVFPFSIPLPHPDVDKFTANETNKDPVYAAVRNIPNLATRIINRIGFIANLNIASFGADQLRTIASTLSIEGGLGLALKLDDHFAVSLSVDRVFSRQLRDEFVDMASKTAKKDRQIRVDDKILTKLDAADDRLFYTNNRTALLFKFVYSF